NKHIMAINYEIVPLNFNGKIKIISELDGDVINSTQHNNPLIDYGPYGRALLTKDRISEYVLELKGAKDHWVKNMNDPDDTRWEYTYHGRLAAYGVWREVEGGKSVERGAGAVDQIDAVVRKRSTQPFTRQAQMITRMPGVDLTCYDPPCLQSV
ncbi:unnamed protein product, partial [marine sediment metagenome]